MFSSSYVDGERDAHREDLEVGHALALTNLVEPDAMEQLDQLTRHGADRTAPTRSQTRPPISFS